ncbi:MAG: hypothetical protein A2Y64_09255 [Candidatus Coatesbacteria bacterium RBG_13_66_14]|uniref:Uncharacterized protein n=1 Tax=Candidatus Coatesbacteria bacterium RBG_13_66_14 TaxID=1817816 RepID=A0A1F5F2E0_9BACT|nr:MAG: hypothetical protein A2Y64_09255 [Candidatus Coatesbacteria bacterium RBG_13_66_14]
MQNRSVICAASLALLAAAAFAVEPGPGPVTSTFSIVAFDPEAREWGVAVASRVLAVGYIVPWARAEVGAVATQAYADLRYGRYGLELLEAGFTAEQALQVLLEFDAEAQQRQVAIVDSAGRVAAFTGAETMAWAGDRQGEHYSVQGNILVGERVLVAMERAYLETGGPLARRLLAAVEAGDEAGGDSRGKQSAALLVVRERGGYQALSDLLVDISVDDDPAPVAELARIYDLWEANFLIEPYLDSADPTVRGYALEIIERALAEKDDAQLFNSMAWVLAVRGLYPERTLEIAHRAHELEPDDPNIMDTVAEAHYAAGDPGSALEWEERALTLDPENGFFLEQRAKFHAAVEGD